jgi:hypothetical protein
LKSSEAKVARSAEKERGSVPLAGRLQSSIRSGTASRAEVKGGSKYMKELTYMPKEKESKSKGSGDGGAGAKRAKHKTI